MAQRILPRVTYQPPEQGGEEEKKKPQSRAGATMSNLAGGVNSFADFMYGMTSPYGENIQAGAPLARGAFEMGQGLGEAGINSPMSAQWWGQPEAGVLPSPYSSAPAVPNAGISARNAYVGAPNASTVPWNPLTQQAPFGPANASKVTYNPSLFGTQFSSGAAGTPNEAINNRYDYMNTPSPTTPPPNTPPPNAPTAGPGNDETVAAWRATLDKNQNLQQQAKDTGNEKEMARLDAEWARLTSTPIYQKMYGGADENAIKQRLINSYMQPGNEAAEPSFERAHARMVTDDWWAEEMTKAGAWGPSKEANDLLWREHWQAMNKGGRDPLDGHPQAVQNLEAKKEELRRMNQQAAYEALQQWQQMSGNA